MTQLFTCRIFTEWSENTMWNISDYQLPIAIAVAMFYVGSFLILGSCCTRKLNRKEGEIPLAIICGMFLYFLLFEMLALPMKIQGQSLTTLAYSWETIIIILDCALLCLNGKYLIGQIQSMIEREKSNQYFWLGLLLLLVIQMAYIYGVTPKYMGVRDDYYYIGDVATSLYKDSIQQYDYITGQKMTTFYYGYFFPMYPMQGAVICRLTGLHPAVENKISAVFVSFCICNLVYYQFARELFKERKKVLGLLAVIALLNFNLQANGVTAAIFYYYRASEGKGILCNIILPFIIYLFYRIQRDSDNWENWGMLFLTIISSYTIVMSAMFLVPVCLTGLFVSLILSKKKWKYCIHMAACMLPCILFLVGYELMAKSYIVFYTK